MDFKIHRTKDRDIIPCDSCGCEVATYPFDWGPPFTEEHDTPHRYLCDFCAGSMTGNHTRYPSRTEFGILRTEIWKAAAAIANYLATKDAGRKG